MGCYEEWILSTEKGHALLTQEHPAGNLHDCRNLGNSLWSPWLYTLWLHCAADYYRDQERWSELTGHRCVGDLELEQSLFCVILSKGRYHCLMTVVVDWEHSVWACFSTVNSHSSWYKVCVLFHVACSSLPCCPNIYWIFFGSAPLFSFALVSHPGHCPKPVGRHEIFCMETYLGSLGCLLQPLISCLYIKASFMMPLTLGPTFLVGAGGTFIATCSSAEVLHLLA